MIFLVCLQLFYLVPSHPLIQKALTVESEHIYPYTGAILAEASQLEIHEGDFQLTINRICAPSQIRV